jgi:flagellar protein FlaG
MNISSISNLASTLSTSSSQASQSLPKPPGPDQKALLQAVKTVNNAKMFGEENELTFKIDPKAGLAIVRIVNRQTGDLVAQIPTEDVLKMAEESIGA